MTNPPAPVPPDPTAATATPLRDSAVVPPSGAWMPGDPVGDRRFLTLERGFALQGGGVLDEVTVAYETWGALDATASNAVLVCHALTGDSHATGRMGHGHPTTGWWKNIVGPGLAVDTDRWFVVCANVLGGCQGTTGPASNDPATGKPYGARFPAVSIRDTVRTQAALADHLGVKCWLSVVGGSMGGMQALEWAITYPDRLRSVAAMATATAASPQQIAWSSVGRSAIRMDPKWREGDYYDAADGDGPTEGLRLAREIGVIHYRSEVEFAVRFGRAKSGPHDSFDLWSPFDVETYLEHHGWKLARRFDANSYLVLNRAMDLHDIGLGRGGIAAALERIRVPALTMAIESDILYPDHLQHALRDQLIAHGVPTQHIDVVSDKGHDAFLVETAQVGEPLASFLADVEKDT